MNVLAVWLESIIILVILLFTVVTFQNENYNNKFNSINNSPEKLTSWNLLVYIVFEASNSQMQFIHYFMLNLTVNWIKNKVQIKCKIMYAIFTLDHLIVAMLLYLTQSFTRLHDIIFTAVVNMDSIIWNYGFTQK